jgi:hypothetical protein
MLRSLASRVLNRWHRIELLRKESQRRPRRQRCNVRQSATLVDVGPTTGRSGHSELWRPGAIAGRNYRRLANPKCGRFGIDLEAANDLIRSQKLNRLPVIDAAAPSTDRRPSANGRQKTPSRVRTRPGF